jgi:hypothetical protein
MVAACTFQLLDRLAMSAISDSPQTLEKWQPLLKVSIFSAIWLSYVRQSSRVARTFTRRARRRTPKPDSRLAEIKA